MSEFLASAEGYDAERLRQLQQVYDWLSPTVEDKRRLALALLASPAKRETFEEMLAGILADLGLEARQASAKSSKVANEGGPP